MQIEHLVIMYTVIIVALIIVLVIACRLILEVKNNLWHPLFSGVLGMAIFLILVVIITSYSKLNNPTYMIKNKVSLEHSCLADY